MTRLQSGQAMSEFLAVCAALALALFYPYVNGESVITLLLRTLTGVAGARSFLVSIL